MLEVDKLNLSKARFELSAKYINTSRSLIDWGDYRTSANRSYYSIFHAMRAVLALEGFDSKKHSGIISRFRHNYIKEGVFSSNLSDIIEDLFRVRNDCDYNDFYVISKEDVEEQLKNAEEFYNEVSKYLTDRWKNE